MRDVRLCALAVSLEAFSSTLARERFLAESTWRALAARRALAISCGSIVGMIGWSAHEAFVELVGLWVEPAERGKGVGRALLEFACEHVGSLSRDVRLAIKADNKAARRLYDALGFVEPEDQRVVDGIVWLHARNPPSWTSVLP